MDVTSSFFEYFGCRIFEYFGYVEYFGCGCGWLHPHPHPTSSLLWMWVTVCNGDPHLITISKTRFFR